ncbi:kinase-like domain-containing protein [Ustulina deusta]|nr:kinase-like domain-containing protein [Ustulina deusta]
MYDPDLIARVYPLRGTYFDAVQKAIQKNPQCRPPKFIQTEPQTTCRDRSSRAPTLPPVDLNVDNIYSLELRFSHIPRSPAGLIFGRDEVSDVVLPDMPGMSRRHFALTYKNTFQDKCYRLVLRDLNSGHGTFVRYDNKQTDEKPRKSFDWILDGFKLPNGIKTFTIQPFKDLQLEIEVNHDHMINSPTYIANVTRFRHGAAGADDLLNYVQLDKGPETECHTAGNDELILLHHVISNGAFGTVSRHWNASTGVQYACKEPRSGEYNKHSWRKEIEIIKRTSHRHIVRCYSAEVEPWPRIFLEYMPMGNLKDAHQTLAFSRGECTAILVQSSSALEYLHETCMIAHRDLKPENILIQHRDYPNRNHKRLYIKLSDFGLSKAGDNLKSWCGTNKYLAPEVGRQRYTRAVDIWSLGVVILELAFGLPSSDDTARMGRQKSVVDRVNSWHPEDLIGVLQHMLVIDAAARYLATECFNEAQKLYALLPDPGQTYTEQRQICFGMPLEMVNQQRGMDENPVPQKEQQKRILRDPPNEYKILEYDPVPIGYIPSMQAINATDLFKLSNVQPRKLGEYLRRHPRIWNHKHKNIDRARGTYIKFSDALRLCREYNLDPGPINQLFPNTAVALKSPKQSSSH